MTQPLVKRISNDIRSLQQGALDQEVLYGLLQRKWTEEVLITTEDLKVKIREFFLYFTKTWCLSETSKWYQACNPQHATTNNSVEGTNNSFKRDFTLNKRLAIPHLVSKISEQLTVWSKDKIQGKVRAETAQPVVVKKAVNLLNIFDSEESDFVLSRKPKDYDRFIVKKEYGIIRGEVLELTIVPKDFEYEGKTKAEFSKVGKAITKRRGTLDYETFDQFRRDLQEAVIIETVQLADGETDWICNCCYALLPSGVKGKVCPHVYLMYLRNKVVKISLKSISEGRKTKGRPANKKNQPSY